MTTIVPRRDAVAMPRPVLTPDPGDRELVLSALHRGGNEHVVREATGESGRRA